jgi:pilus assembly protein Flp/PilA
MQMIVNRFLRDDTGTTSIEYVLIASLVSVAILAAVTLLGSQLKATFEYVEAAAKQG